MNNQVILSPEAFKINAKDWCSQIETFIQEQLRSSCRDGIVVPISGGLDSSVVAALCVWAIGKDKVIGLMMPERFGNPEANRYGRLIADHLGITTIKVNISPFLRNLGTANVFLAAISGRERWKGMVDRYLEKRNKSAQKLYLNALKGQADPASRKLMAGVSAKQRVRFLIAYKIAEGRNYLVAGSSHKTEQMVGLFVKYGIDDAADIMPLKNIYRSQTLQLAEYLEIPQEIVRRTPNPDILPGITDKYRGYFGISSLQVELILLGYQNGMHAKEIADQTTLSEPLVQQMLEIIARSEFSRSHAAAPELR